MKPLRLFLALVGFGTALLAVALGDRRIGWAAIAILLLSLIIRLLRPNRADKPRDDEPAG
ncbi:MAG: hypothetical protein ABI766_01325 [Gemmatimonadales bacterium]